MMVKLLAKLAEKYAKSTNTACIVLGIWHQPKMPASLIKKD
ncbi:MAG: cyclic lactone autoinducer peptide [Clostridia bacterium]|nr:cyclic lactone autoinducer peptide [Clostridia bacterium]